MKKYGLIGKKLGHSFSREFFNEKFKQLDLKNHYYENYDLENLLEIDKDNLEKSKKILKENNVHYELIGITQKNNIELSGEMKINIKDLYQINNKWYYNY